MITLEAFLEEWLVDLGADEVLLGPDWDDNLSGEEVEPADLVSRYLKINGKA